METWIQQILSADHAGFTVLIAVFFLGIISVFTCVCNFSIIAVVAGYSGTIGASGKTKVVIWNSLLFFTGMLISMSVIGGIIGYASELISASFGNYWKIAAGIVSVFFGLFTLDLIPFKIPNITISRSGNHQGIFSSVVFGLTIGGLTLATGACCNPVLPVILAVSFVKGSFVWGVMLLFVYALGYGIAFTTIMMGIGLGFGKTSHIFAKFGTVLKYVGGIIMLVVGFYLLLTV